MHWTRYFYRDIVFKKLNNNDVTDGACCYSFRASVALQGHILECDPRLPSAEGQRPQVRPHSHGCTPRKGGSGAANAHPLAMSGITLGGRM